MPDMRSGQDVDSGLLLIAPGQVTKPEGTASSQSEIPEEDFKAKIPKSSGGNSDPEDSGKSKDVKKAAGKKSESGKKSDDFDFADFVHKRPAKSDLFKEKFHATTTPGICSKH